MEGSVPAAPRRAPRRRVLLVLAVAAVVIVAGFVVWWGFLRARTIAEVFAFDHFQAGSAVTVAGTITGVYRENTTYGPRVALQLDKYECNITGFLTPQNVFGDPNATYTIGQTFQTTLHFQSYTINGDPAVTAPELACPFPDFLTSLQASQDGVSRVAGLALVYNATEPGGWLDYRVFTANQARYELSVLPVTLRKAAPVPKGNPMFPTGSAVDSPERWTALTGIQLVGSLGSSSAFPVVDQMTSLAEGTSANGSLRYVDANGDRMLDDGDRLDVRILPIPSSNSWDTYLLQVGNLFFNNLTYVADQHFILNGPAGPLEPLLSSQLPMFDLAYAGTQPGPPLASTVQLTSVPIGPPLPLAAIRYTLTVQSGGTEYSQLSGNLTSLPATTSAGATLSFSDSSGNHLLDSGDRFTVTGAANQSSITLFLFGPAGGGGYINWIVGYGSVGRFSNPSFTAQGSGPWTIRANVPTWSPELAFNRTVRATLYENGTAVVTNAALASGTLGTFAAGSLTFMDADGDGYLSTGDFFTLTGNPGASYRLDLTFFFGEDVVHAF